MAKKNGIGHVASKGHFFPRGQSFHYTHFLYGARHIPSLCSESQNGQRSHSGHGCFFPSIFPPALEFGVWATGVSVMPRKFAKRGIGCGGGGLGIKIPLTRLKFIPSNFFPGIMKMFCRNKNREVRRCEYISGYGSISSQFGRGRIYLGASSFHPFLSVGITFILDFGYRENVQHT